MLRRSIALVAALVIGAPRMVDAATSLAPLNGYRIRSWSGGEGIRLGNVRQIVQDQDGYLWLASSAGLVRFDGVRFSTTGIVEGSDLPAVQSRTVYLARDGALWVGYGSGRGVYRIRNGEVLGTYLQNQITGFVNAILEDHEGVVWIAHEEGLHRLTRAGLQRVDLPYPTGDHRVLDVHEDRSGALWVAAANALYKQSAGGRFEQAARITEPMFNMSFSEDPHGRLWVTDPVHGFRPVDGAAARDTFGRGVNLHFDREGALWVATFGQGLWKVRDAGDGALSIARATVDAGLLSDELSGFLEDRDGNLWVGANVGLHRLTPNKAVSVVDVGVVHGVATSNDGTTWLGGTSGLIALTVPRGALAGEQRRVVTTQEVRTLHRASDGSVWVATAAGLFRVVNGRLAPASGVRLTHVYAMASDRRATLWVCDEVEGLVSVTGNRVSRVDLDTSDGSGRPSVVAVDSQDRLWIAFADGTLRMIRNGVMQRFGRADGLLQSTIFTIHDSGNGRVWVGGDHGLSHFVNGRFETLDGRNLPGERVLQVASDMQGNLWLGLPVVGFIRLNPGELARALSDPSYRLRYAVYTSSDGIAGAPDTFSGNGVATDRDGRLWFVTSRGVTILDPESLKQNRNVDAAQPRIEGATAGGRWYRARAGSMLAAGVTALRIDYARVNLATFDQVRFRYRLDGVDPDWIDGTGRRDASYTNVRPGDYRFRVQATSTGTWDDPETTWAFAIAPLFYQTQWFRGSCVLAVALALVGLWRLRLRQIRKELAVVYNERVRLSREIHDTLLQSLAGVAMQLDVASSDPGAPTRTRIAMLRMRRQLEDYMQETRESIWNLRSGTMDERDIVTALRGLGQRITSGRVRFAMNVTGTPRSCEPQLRSEVVRIAQEAVMNAVRHAGAKQVQVHLGFDERTLRLSVSDDGQGFDPAAVAASHGRHYGLIGMQERAAGIGGRCTIESRPGGGSHVVAEFPLSA